MMMKKYLIFKKYQIWIKKLNLFMIITKKMKIHGFHFYHLNKTFKIFIVSE